MNKSMISGLVVVMATATAMLIGCGGSEGTSTQQSPVRGSSSGSGSNNDNDNETDTSPTEPAAAEEACVPAGAKANSKGVGAFCKKGDACPGDSFCTGDFGAPIGAQFCTIFCATDAECGDGARCFHEGRGSACVPNACKTN